MPWASRPAALSCSAASRAGSRIGAPLPVEGAGRQPRLASMTVTLLTASPSRRSGRAPSARLRPGPGPGSASWRGPRPAPSAAPSIPGRTARPAFRAGARARPGTWPPVEAVSSRSPRRTMAGTWKSHSGSTSSTLTSTPRRAGAGGQVARFAFRPGPPRTAAAGLPAASSETVVGSRRASTPASASRAARRSRSVALAGQADLQAHGIEDKGKHQALSRSREVCPADLKCKN